MKKIVLVLLTLTYISASVFGQGKVDALALYRSQKFAEAAAVCIQELQTNPRNIDSYVVLCWSLVKDRKYAEAESYAIEGRKINASDSRLIEILAESKYYLGKNTQALELFQLYVAARESGARLGNAYYYMGEIYIRQKQYLHADMALSSAVHAEPNVANWWSRCGYAREMAGYYLSSLEAYKKALALDANHADALRGKSRMERRLK